MEFFFELLREAGIRLPRPVGSAVSIVGALVIGEAAINAGIASPIMVIIVALTGIASFAIPQYNFAIALRILRFPLMLFAAFLGIFGILIAFMLIWLHLANLRTLGQPYLSPIGPFIPRQIKDIFIRAPLGILMRSPRIHHKASLRNKPTMPYSGENKNHEKADMDELKLIGTFRIDRLLGSGRAS